MKTESPFSSNTVQVHRYHASLIAMTRLQNITGGSSATCATSSVRAYQLWQQRAALFCRHSSEPSSKTRPLLLSECNASNLFSFANWEPFMPTQLDVPTSATRAYYLSAYQSISFLLPTQGTALSRQSLYFIPIQQVGLFHDCQIMTNQHLTISFVLTLGDSCQYGPVCTWMKYHQNHQNSRHHHRQRGALTCLRFCQSRSTHANRPATLWGASKIWPTHVIRS